MVLVHRFPHVTLHISLKGAIPVKWDFNKRNPYGIWLNIQDTVCLSQWCWAENTVLFENTTFRYKCNLPEQNHLCPGSIEHMHFIKLSFWWTFKFFFLFLGEACSSTWVFVFVFFPPKCCLGVLCNYLVFQRQVVFENSAVDHCAGCRIAYYSLLPEARQSPGMQEQAHSFDISAATETILLCLTSEWIFRAKWASGWLLIDFYSPSFLTTGHSMKFIDCEGVTVAKSPS